MILKDENSESSNSLYYCQKWTKRSSENKKGIYIYISIICIYMYKEFQLVAGKQRNLLCTLKNLPFHCDKAVSLGGGQQHLYFSHQIPWDVARRWIWTDAIVHKPLWNSCALLTRRLRWRAWPPGWRTDVRGQSRVRIGTALSDVGSRWVWWWKWDH